MGRRTTIVAVKSKFKIVGEDAKDDAVLNTVREFKRIKIVTITEMLDVLGKM